MCYWIVKSGYKLAQYKCFKLVLQKYCLDTRPTSFVQQTLQCSVPSPLLNALDSHVEIVPYWMKGFLKTLFTFEMSVLWYKMSCMACMLKLSSTFVNGQIHKCNIVTQNKLQAKNLIFYKCVAYVETLCQWSKIDFTTFDTRDPAALRKTRVLWLSIECIRWIFMRCS